MGEVFTDLAQAYRHGGFWMIPISAFQAFSFAIMAERVYALFLKVRLNKEVVLMGCANVSSVATSWVAFAFGRPSPLTRILKAGCWKFVTAEEVQAAMDEARKLNCRTEKRTVISPFNEQRSPVFSVLR